MKKLSIVILFISIAFLGCKSTQKAPIITAEQNQPKITELQETHWKLVELMGKPVVLSDGNKEGIYIIFQSEDKTVNGFAGCNIFMGQYELLKGNRISFSKIATTLMACPDLDIESEFNKMLGTVDNYSISGNSLTLNKAKMTPLAKFEAVKMK